MFFTSTHSSVWLPVTVACILMTAISSCNVSNTGSKGMLQVWLTDAPANFEAVYIDIRSIRVHKSAEAETDSSQSDEEAEEDGWLTRSYDEGPIDLLELRNGNELILAELELEPGIYNQVRLILGENNEVVIDGQTHPLQTPGAQQSGLKIVANADITDGGIFSLLIDFDVARSIVETGNGDFILKPVLRTLDLAGSGSITGIVEPGNFLTAVTVVNESDTLSTLTDDGAFTLLGVTPGAYNIILEPSDEQYADTTLTDVTAAEGETTDLGTVVLQPVE